MEYTKIAEYRDVRQERVDHHAGEDDDQRDH